MRRWIVLCSAVLAFLLAFGGVWPSTVRADTPVFPVFDGYPKQGCYGYVVGSTGMWDGRGTIQVTVPGPVVDAWLIWQGVNDTDDPGNPDTNVLEINGQPVIGQMVDSSVYSRVHAPWYQWVADVGPNGYNLIVQGQNTLDVFEWWPLDTYRDGSGAQDPRRNGVSLMVIYDRSPCSDPVEIVPFYGSDFIWWQGDPALDGGPLSENHVFTFDPSPLDRRANLVINFAGVSHTAPLAGICRDTAIWAAVGSGTPPDAIVQTGYPGSTGINGGVLVGDNLFNISPPCPQAIAYPLVDYSGGFVGAEWSTTDLVFDIPAGNEWLAVQLESVVTGVPPARPGGESGAWAGGLFMIPLPPPDVTVEKTDGLTEAEPGDVITYTVTFENIGPGLAQGVVVSDTLPARTTFVDCTTTLGTCTASGNTVVIDVGDLAPGESGTAFITVALDPVFPVGTTDLVNQAVITTITDGDDPLNNVAEDVTSVTAFVAFTLSKMDVPDPVDTGDVITYTLNWEVGGNAFANGVLITDTLPNDATFVAADAGGMYDGVTHTVVWQLGNLLPGDTGTVTLVVRSPERAEDGTLLTNEATISDTPRTASETVQETTTVRSADVTATVYDDANGNGVQDTGEGGVSGATVCIYAADDLVSPVECADTDADGNVAFLNLPPGDYVLRLTATPAGYEPTTPDQVPITAPAGSMVHTVFGIAQPGLELRKAFDVPPGTPIKVEVGDRITFTIQIDNTGGLPLVTVPLRDTYDPTVLQFISATPTPDTTTPAGTLAWTDLTGAGDLAPGDSLVVTVVFEATAQSGGTANTATVDGARTPGGQVLPSMSDAVSFSVQEPTAVTMASILAEFDGEGAVILTWVTTAEFDNWGFNVYRAEVNDPTAAVRVNDSLIPGRGQAVSGATYRFVDTTVQPGKTYWYWVVDVDYTGRATWHGPVEVYVPKSSPDSQTFLPAIWTW